MIRDPYLNGQVEGRIASGQSAEAALSASCDLFIDLFTAAEDEVTRQRAADVRDLRGGMLRLLLGLPRKNTSSFSRLSRAKSPMVWMPIRASRGRAVSTRSSGCSRPAVQVGGQLFGFLRRVEGRHGAGHILHAKLRQIGQVLLDEVQPHMGGNSGDAAGWERLKVLFLLQLL